MLVLTVVNALHLRRRSPVNLHTACTLPARLPAHLPAVRVYKIAGQLDTANPTALKATWISARANLPPVSQVTCQWRTAAFAHATRTTQPPALHCDRTPPSADLTCFK